MDCLFRSVQPMVNLPKYNISTAASFSVNDIFIFGCKGGNVKIYSIQSKKCIKSFNSYFPCIHKLYYESIGNNIISVESNETHDRFCIVCYNVSTSWHKSSTNTSCDVDSGTPTFTYLPLPLQNVTFETKLCAFSGRIALLDQDSGTVNIWQCPAGTRVDFEHYVEIGFKIHPTRYQPNFFIHDNILGYVYEDKLTILKLNLVNLVSNLLSTTTSPTAVQKVDAIINNVDDPQINNNKISIDMSGKDVIFHRSNNVNANANEFLGSLWLRANSSSWKWLDNSCAMASCIIIGDEGSVLKKNAGGKYNVKRLRAGASLQTLVKSFTYDNITYNKEYKRNVKEQMLGVLVINNRYGWLYNIQINSTHDNTKYYKNCNAKFWTKYEFTSRVSSVCFKLPFLYVKTFAGIEIWTMPVIKDNENTLNPCLVTIVQTGSKYTRNSSSLLLKTKRFLGLINCNYDNNNNKHKHMDMDPDNIDIDTSRDPELHQYNNNGTAPIFVMNQIFKFDSIDCISQKFILKAMQSVNSQDKFYFVLLNIYNSVNASIAVLNYKSIDSDSINTHDQRKHYLKPADILMKKLQTCRATSLLSVYLVNYFIKNDDHINGLKCLAQANLKFKNALALIHKVNAALMPIYLIWLWQFDRIEQIHDFYTMLQNGEIDLSSIIKFDIKSSLYLFGKYILTYLIASGESRGGVEYKNMNSFLISCFKILSKFKQQDVDIQILQSIFFLCCNNDKNRDNSHCSTITVLNINKLFDTYCESMPGSSKIPFLLYLAKRKNDWKLTSFGRNIFLRYPEVGVSILNNIINELSKDQLDGFLMSFDSLNIKLVRTLIQVYELCAMAYPLQKRFQNKLANIYAQILEMKPENRKEINATIGKIHIYNDEMAKWHSELIKSLFPNELSFERRLVNFLLLRMDKIDVNMIFKRMKDVENDAGHAICLLLSYELGNARELLLSLSKLYHYFWTNNIGYVYQRIINGILKELIVKKSYKVIDKMFCELLKNDNEYENQEIFRSLIHVYAKNRESNSYETLIFDEMRTLKTSLTKLQRLCRAQSAAEILKTI